MLRIPTDRTPTHPGGMLKEESLRPMGISQQQLARSIEVSYQRINEIVNHRRGVSPATALGLAKYFGNTAAFWMNLQLRWDLFHVQKSEEAILRNIQPLHRAG